MFSRRRVCVYAFIVQFLWLGTCVCNRESLRVYLVYILTENLGRETERLATRPHTPSTPSPWPVLPSRCPQRAWSYSCVNSSTVTQSLDRGVLSRPIPARIRRRGRLPAALGAPSPAVLYCRNVAVGSSLRLRFRYTDIIQRWMIGKDLVHWFLKHFSSDSYYIRNIHHKSRQTDVPCNKSTICKHSCLYCWVFSQKSNIYINASMSLSSQK